MSGFQLRTLVCGPTRRENLTFEKVGDVWRLIGRQRLAAAAFKVLTEAKGRRTLSVRETAIACDWVPIEIQRRTLAAAPRFASLKDADRAFGYRWNIPDEVMQEVAHSHGG